MNPFFNWSFDVAPGSANRSRPVENEFAAIGVGFDQVAAYFARAPLVPIGETLGALPALTARRNKTFAFDANGNPIATTAANSAEMQAAVDAAVQAQASASEAVAAAATVAGASSYIQQLMLAQGVI